MKNICLLLFCTIIYCASAQNYSRDWLFNDSPGFNGTNNNPNNYVAVKTSIQTDGKIVAVGSFDSYNNVTANGIIRLNTNGTIDTTFTTGTGFFYSPKSVAIQLDGKILIGANGNFNQYNGTPVKPLVRLNSNGTLDSIFNIGCNIDYGVINSIAIQPDGKILVGGHLEACDQSVMSFCRLNSNGTLDLTFNAGLGGWMLHSNCNFPQHGVKSIAIQLDGKIIVGGDCLDYGNQFPNILRFNSNGSFDATFNLGYGFDGPIETIALQLDSKIVVGGDFSNYNGIAANNIIRLNPNGAVDLTFNAGSGFSGGFGHVYDLKILSNGKIIVGGAFDSYNGIPQNALTRLSNNGIIDGSFNVGLGFGCLYDFAGNLPVVVSVTIQLDGKILISGYFDAFNAVQTHCFVRLHPCANIPANQIINTLSCGVYTSPTGQTYSQSGTYTEIVPTNLGCDSIIYTINLTINSTNYIGNVVQTQEPFCQPNSSGQISVSTIQPFNGSLIISEYYSGPGSNKWIELYNASTASIDLGQLYNSNSPFYNPWRYVLSNGTNYVFPPNTIILPFSTIRISNPSATSPSIYTSSIINGGNVVLAQEYINWNTITYDAVNPILGSTLERLPSIYSPNPNFVNMDWGILPLNSSTPNFHQNDVLSTNNLDYSVIWSNAQVGNVLNNISSGTYSFDIVHNQSGCVIDQDTIFLPNIQNDSISITPSPAFGNAPLNVAFANQTPNLNNYNFTWYFGDGTSQQSNAPFLSHTYTQNGYADVTVMADNLTSGCISSQTFNDMIFVIGGITCVHTSTINQNGPLTGCVGDSILLSSNTDPSFTYQWNKNGIPVSGATGSSFYPTLSGTYTVTIYQNNCPVTSAGISVTFNLLPSVPTITSVGSIIPCLGGSMTLSAPNGFASYLWNSGSTASSLVVSQSGNYTVSVTNNNGCSQNSNPFAVNASFMAVPQVCIVGVDSLTNENRVVWEKPLTQGIDSFYVYKESNVSNIYTKIGATDFNALAIFLDVNSNPAVQAYRYKISALDTCGVETNVGNFHKTVHLTINQGLGGAWNLIWSHYEGLIFGSYNIYRGTDPSNISLLTTIQSNLNSYTDLSPPAGPLYYQIELVNPVNCDPTKIVNYSAAKSNIVNNFSSDIIEIANKFIKLYPNPTNGFVTLEVSIEKIGKTYSILDFSGRTIRDGKISSAQEQIDLQGVARGVYYLSIENGSSVIKLVKQ